MFFCKNQGGGWGGPIILNWEFTNCPPPQNRNFRLFQFPVISSQATWPAHPKILSKILFKFILRRWCPVCCFPTQGGRGPRAKQYAVSRFMFENLAGPTIIFDPMTLRPENTSIGCYSTIGKLSAAWISTEQFRFPRNSLTFQRYFIVELISTTFHVVQ